MCFKYSFYYITKIILFISAALSSKQFIDNIPLLLKCGHSVCENCITNLVKFDEPINCKVCHKDMEIAANDAALLLQNKLKVRQLFPVNIYMLGEISLELIEVIHKILNCMYFQIFIAMVSNISFRLTY